MPKYFFQAKTVSGEEKAGFLEAKDIRDLVSQLKKEGLILIKAEIEQKKEKGKFSLPSFSIPLSEKLFFTKNLKVMISAGVPLTRAILNLAEQTKNKKFKNILNEIGEKITKGERFSDALSFYPEVFPEIYYNMIKVGEESGTLEQSLEILATQMEKEKEIKDKIKSAMIYPSVILVLMLGIAFLMLAFVVPKLTEALMELEVELPPTTKFVIFLGQFFSQNFSLFLLIFGGIFFFFFQFLKTPFGKSLWDSVLLKIPIVSDIVKKSNSALLARTLSSLISAGVSLPKSLEICAKTLTNVHFKNAVLKSAEKVKSGQKLSQSLIEFPKLIPLTLISMIEVGEESGETTTTLSTLATFYETEVDNITRNLSSLIEPILLILIAGAVGFFAISMLQPIYSAMQSLSNF
ncbi:type II secretion system F family protein [Candidatus Parcubacteria bacterium]|nr:type II secretion system F family protein [Candidatus Parcubacteria bacterium]